MKTKWTLTGKKALITGATKGIGKAIALEFAELGAEVLIISRNEHEVNELRDFINHNSGTAISFRADVTVESERIEIKNLIEKKWGKLDILVNNAGTNIRKRTNEFNQEEIDFLFDINFDAPYSLCRLMHSLLKSQKGSSIINISSAAASGIVRTGSVYASAKAALSHLTRYLAVEWASENIRVNAIEPWYIRTPLTKPVLENESRLGMILERTPMKRVGEPEEVANLAAFLAMDLSSYISGEVISVDGAATKLLL